MFQKRSYVRSHMEYQVFLSVRAHLPRHSWKACHHFPIAWSTPWFPRWRQAKIIFHFMNDLWVDRRRENCQFYLQEETNDKGNVFSSEAQKWFWRHFENNSSWHCLEHVHQSFQSLWAVSRHVKVWMNGTGLHFSLKLFILKKLRLFFILVRGKNCNSDLTI